MYTYLTLTGGLLLSKFNDKLKQIITLVKKLNVSYNIKFEKTANK